MRFPALLLTLLAAFSIAATADARPSRPNPPIGVGPARVVSRPSSTATSATTATSPTTPSTTSSRCPAKAPFAAGSPWNSPLPETAAVDPSSAALVSRLAQQAEHTVGFNTTEWSVPIYRVPAGQPTVRVTLDGPNRYLQQAWAAVPLPPTARPAAGTDAHLVVWQPSTDTMWEFWRMQLEIDGWHAGYGGRIVEAEENPGYYLALDDGKGEVAEQSWWGATATGLPLPAGLVTLDDVRCGEINHALALALPEIRKGVIAWPAERGDGRSLDPDSIPEGARLRLDPRLDLSKLSMPPITRMLAQAAQRYGLIVRDGGGAVALYGEDPKPYGSNPWPTLLEGLKPWQFMPRFPWSHLQVLKMQLQSYP
jgi:hypothetical protein